MGRVIHFAIAADDPERASNFYTRVFKWEIQKWAGPLDYRLVTTGPQDQPGINGAIMKRDSPGITTVNTIDVPSVDEYADKIVKAGGKVLTPRMPIPGVGYFAYCQDTEGNRFGIMQEDRAAK